MNELATRTQYKAPSSIPSVTTSQKGSQATHGWVVTVGLTLLLGAGIGVLGGPEPRHADAMGASARVSTHDERPGFVVAPAARRARIIRHAFGRYGAAAVRVARCESGLDPAAHNGQFLGMFQMGAAERARYGHGISAAAQARAARAYFNATGRDWSPWSCKP